MPETTVYSPTIAQAPVSYAAPAASPWYSVGSTPVTVQRASYTAPATYNTPITTYRPITYSTPVTTVGATITTYRPVVAAPAAIQPVTVPAAPAYPVDTTTFRPVLPIVSMSGNSFVGRGMLGQPEVYTEGQPVRNFFRYLLP